MNPLRQNRSLSRRNKESQRELRRHCVRAQQTILVTNEIGRLFSARLSSYPAVRAKPQFSNLPAQRKRKAAYQHHHRRTPHLNESNRSTLLANENRDGMGAYVLSTSAFGSSASGWKSNGK